MSTTPMHDAEIRDAASRGETQLLRADSPVSEWSIRAWCAALGDRNPAYLDSQEAVRAGRGGIIAPPVMMHSFTLPTPLNPETASPAKRLRQRFAFHGFTSVVAVTYEQEYGKPVRVGDLLKREVSISAVSEEKQVSLGAGYFVTTAHRITNQHDELIGTLLVRVLYFRPRGAGDSDRRPSMAKGGNGTAERPGGIEIPPFEIPITTTLVVTAALATNDFEPVHHDRDHAQREGLPDIIMNILSSSGLAMRYVTDWSGPATVVKKLSVRLLAPNCPGDTLVLRGWAGDASDGERRVHVSGTNARGTHIQAELILGSTS